MSPNEQELLMDAMDVSNLVQPADSSTVNLSSITCCIQGLVVHFGCSPQRSGAFTNTTTAMQQLDEEHHHIFEDDPKLQDSSMKMKTRVLNLHLMNLQLLSHHSKILLWH